MPTQSRIRRLDGIRGAAVVLVVVYHASYLTAGWGPRLLPGGFIGVDLFFVLSGYLITRILLTELEDGSTIVLGRFALRRWFRLFPALAVAVAAVSVLLVALGRIGAGADQISGPDLVRAGVGTLAYVSNYQQAWGWDYPMELSHTWSLAIEAQFYLGWPLVLMAFHRFHLPRKAQIGLVLAAIVAVGVHRALMWTDQAHYLPLYLRTDTRLDVILGGCLLAMSVHWGLLRGSARWLRLPSLVGVGVFAVAATMSETGDVTMYRNFGFTLVALAAMAIVASVLLDDTGPLARVGAFGPLARLGDRSYSLYLWHVPVFLTVARRIGDQPVAWRLTVGLVVTAALTEVSYRLVESRYRRGAPTAAVRPTLPDRLHRLASSHRVGFERGFVVLGAAPMLVAVVALSRYAWYPIGDLAQAMMRQLSFWSDPPLVGPAGRIGTFARQGNHPGPAMFWFTWPIWWLLGRSSWAYQASVAAAVVGAYATAVVASRRLGGWLVGLTVATIGAVLMRSFGPVALTQPWNPYIPLLAFLVFTVTCWAVSCGHWAQLPIAVAAGSFCVQCHVGYAPAAVAGLAVAIAVGLAPQRWLPAAQPRTATGRGLRWLAVSVAVGAAMWLPPLIDQITRDPGNVSILLETYDAQTGEVIGVRAGTKILLTQFDPVGNWLLGTRRVESSIVPGLALIAAWAVGTVVAWRKRNGMLLRLDLVLGALFVTAWYWAIRLDSTRLLYLIEWFWVIAALMVVSVIWAGSLVFQHRPRWAALSTGPVAVSVLTAVLMVSTASFTWTAVGVAPPDMRYSDTVRALAGPVVESLDPSQRYLMNWVDPDALGGNGFGLMLELERHGFDVGAIEPRSAAVEPHRVRTLEEVDAVITVVSGDDNISRVRAMEGVTELAFDDHRSELERFSYVSLRSEVMEELRTQGLGEIADMIPTTIWFGLNDARVTGEQFDKLAQMLTIGQATAVFVSKQPLEGL